MTLQNDTDMAPYPLTAHQPHYGEYVSRRCRPHTQARYGAYVWAGGGCCD